MCGGGSDMSLTQRSTSSGDAALSRSGRWMLTATVLVVVALNARCAGPRVVMVPDGEPVQLAETVEAHVYVQVNGERVRSWNTVTLHEGWWIVYDEE